MGENSRVLKPTDEWLERHIIPEKLTYDLKRVLFVCIGGSGISKSAMGLFKEAAEGKQLSAAIRMDVAGTHNFGDLKIKLAKADYVVPMSPVLIPTIRKAMKCLEKKPKILNARFNERSIAKKAIYRRLFGIVNKAGHRQFARRLYKY